MSNNLAPRDNNNNQVPGNPWSLWLYVLMLYVALSMISPLIFGTSTATSTNSTNTIDISEELTGETFKVNTLKYEDIDVKMSGKTETYSPDGELYYETTFYISDLGATFTAKVPDEDIEKLSGKANYKANITVSYIEPYFNILLDKLVEREPTIDTSDNDTWKYQMTRLFKVNQSGWNITNIEFIWDSDIISGVMTSGESTKNLQETFNTITSK